MAKSKYVSGKVKVGPVSGGSKPKPKYAKPAAGSVVKQPKPVAKDKGVAVQYQDGKPTAFVQPGFAPGVSLAPGWGIQYGPDGKPVAFIPPKQGGTPGGGGSGGQEGGGQTGGNQGGGQPAPQTPSVDPFFTPEDIIAMNSWIGGINDQRAQWVSGLTGAQADTGYQTAQLTQSAKQNTAAASDNAIARGIFQSSIKDASIYDIEAQRSMQQGMLDQRLKQVTSDYDAWVSRYGGTMSNGQKVAMTPEEAAANGAPLGTEAARYFTGWTAKQRQNAVDVSNTMVPPPTAATSTGQTAPKPTTTAPKPTTSAPKVTSVKPQPTTSAQPKNPTLRPGFSQSLADASRKISPAQQRSMVRGASKGYAR